MYTMCVYNTKRFIVYLQIEDMKFKLSNTEEKLIESNSQLNSAVSELQLYKDHCVKLEENRNDLTVQLERSRSDLVEVCVNTMIMVIKIFLIF